MTDSAEGCSDEHGLRVFRSVRARNRAVAVTVAIAVVGLVSAWVVHAYASSPLSPTWARETVREFGAWAPAVFVALQAVQVVLAPIPGQTLGFLGGYLFGAVPGTTYSMLGMIAGSLLVFRVVGAYGRGAVESWVTDAVLERFDGFVDERGVAALSFFEERIPPFTAGVNPTTPP
jgi:uncharacterized membrane protein YdjX (TVP38/TMEM64 family)